MRALPSLKSVALVNQLPFADNFWGSGIRLKPEQLGPGESSIGVANYIGSEGWLQTLGVKLVARRDFNGDEYQDQTVVDQATPRSCQP